MQKAWIVFQVPWDSVDAQLLPGLAPHGGASSHHAAGPPSPSVESLYLGLGCPTTNCFSNRNTVFDTTLALQGRDSITTEHWELGHRRFRISFSNEEPTEYFSSSGKLERITDGEGTRGFSQSHQWLCLRFQTLVLGVKLSCSYAGPRTQVQNTKTWWCYYLL